VSYFFFAIFLVLAFQLRGIPFREVSEVNSFRSLFVVVDTALMSIAMMAYFFFTARVRYRAPFWRTLGWRPFPERFPRPLVYAACVLGGGIFAVIIGLASAAVGKKGTLPIEKLLQDRNSTFLLMGLGILVAPLVEETIFRGFLYPLLARSFGVSAGVLSVDGKGIVTRSNRSALELLALPEDGVLERPLTDVMPELAPLVVQKIRDLIQELNAGGMSVLLVEQNAAMALSIADHGYVMETGRIVMDRAAADLQRDADIREFYLGLRDSGERKSYAKVKHYTRRKRWLS